MNIEGKVIAITGAAGGIGRATSLVCANYGAKIVVIDVIEKGVLEVIEAIRAKKGEAIGLVLDVSDREAVKKGVQEIVSQYGHIDVLLNAAGAFRDGILHEISNEDFTYVWETNLIGTFNMGSEIAKVMINNKKGLIINILSKASNHAEYANGPCCVTEAAIRMLTQIQTLELKKYGISAIMLDPGIVNTEFMQQRLKSGAEKESITIEEYCAIIAKELPMRRLSEPCEFGELIAFLSSEHTCVSTHNDILYSGGSSMLIRLHEPC